MEIYRDRASSESTEPMNNVEFSIGQHVKMHTNDEWNGLVGTVENLVGNTITVRCNTLSAYPCYIDTNDACRVLKSVR